MGIATAIAKFLHRAKRDTVSTEAELKKVVEAVQPEVDALRNAVVDELRDGLAHAVGDVKDGMTVLGGEHKTTIAAAVSELEKPFADIFKRFDDIEARLKALKADVARKTAQPAKAAPAAKPDPATPEPAPAAEAPEAPAEQAPKDAPKK